MKTYFVYDKETGYIISGFDCCEDDCKDGYNVYTRPYKYKELHPKNEKCRLDYLYHSSKKEGLSSLKYDNMIVSVVDHPYDVKCHFVENPNYLNDKYAVRGWWKLDETVPTL